MLCVLALTAYKFINIHQRAKTSLNSVAVFSGISLSIFIREPKQLHAIRDRNLCISLSIFIREPKQENQQKIDSLSISLSIFIREPKQVYRFGDTGGCISLSIFIREPKQLVLLWRNLSSISLSIFIREPKQDYYCSECGQYKFINIHQRAKTATSCGFWSVSANSTQFYYNSRISLLSR